MNFNDYVLALNQQDKYLEEITLITIQLEDIIGLHKNWVNEAFEKTYSRKIANNGTLSVALSENTIKYFNTLREAIIKIDFLDFGETLNKFKEVNIQGFEDKNIQLYNELRKTYKVIHKYRGLTDIDQRIDGYNEFIGSINTMIEIYDKFKFMIKYVNAINFGLSQGVISESLEIRLLNENNTVADLIENMTLINNIYNSINKLIDEKEELRYCRVESGSLETFLCGCYTTLLAMKPILEFSYKIYSEQLSRKSKLEVQEKQIKVRREYLMLIKEVKDLKPDISEKELLTWVGDLDQDIKQFFKKNPFILLDEKKLGREELNNSDIQIELLKSGDEESLSLSELKDEEIKD